MVRSSKYALGLGAALTSATISYFVLHMASPRGPLLHIAISTSIGFLVFVLTQLGVLLGESWSANDPAALGLYGDDVSARSVPVDDLAARVTDVVNGLATKIFQVVGSVLVFPLVLALLLAPALGAGLLPMYVSTLFDAPSGVAILAFYGSIPAGFCIGLLGWLAYGTLVD